METCNLKNKILLLNYQQKSIFPLVNINYTRAIIHNINTSISRYDYNTRIVAYTDKIQNHLLWTFLLV